MELPSALAQVLVKLLDVWTFPVLRFGINGGLPYAKFLPGAKRTETVDERLEKIEAAKRNLEDALGAIGELQKSAEENKAELAAAIERLNAAQAQRLVAERELQAVRAIAQNDVAVFQKLAGVPSKIDIAKERVVGFVLGVLASVAASGIWWLVSRAWPLLKS
jgi:hypothetical protein